MYVAPLFVEGDAISARKVPLLGKMHCVNDLVLQAHGENDLLTMLNADISLY